MARKLNGATAFATTSWAARRAGIRVFATGGIGGVHRTAVRSRGVRSQEPGVRTSLRSDHRSRASTHFLATDITRLPTDANAILVVSAGAKAILDLPATLEWLETHGVTVVGYGTDRFPAFCDGEAACRWTCANTPAEVAALYRASARWGCRAAC